MIANSVPGLRGVRVAGPDNFQHTVVGLLNVIRGTKTGDAVLQNISSGGMIEIEPEPDVAACDPQADSAVNRHQCKVLAAASVIQFSPNLALSVRKRSRACREIWMSGDEILLHELVHGMRKTHRALDCAELHGVLKRFDDREEFFAILIENIYRSERKLGKHFKDSLERSIPLRHDHDLGMMTAGQAKGFLSNVLCLELVLVLWNDPRMEPMCRKIADVDTAFNPIRWARAEKPLQSIRSLAEAPIIQR